jgi:hypothetical protein
MQDTTTGPRPLQLWQGRSSVAGDGVTGWIHPSIRRQANNGTQTQSKLDFSLSFYITPVIQVFHELDNLEKKCTKSVLS